jgi:hypothetical protein
MKKPQLRRHVLVAAGVLTSCLLAASCSSGPAAGTGGSSGGSTVWLCRPGLAADPCAEPLTTTTVSATGTTAVSTPKPASPGRFACFYVYGTVSRERSVNADLKRGQAEIDSARVQAAPFAPYCQLYAPVYRQVTLADLAAHPDLNFGPAETVTAYDSIAAGFGDFLRHDLDGRPFVVIGDSQGAAMLNLLLRRMVDDVPALRAELLVAIILGGNVEVPAGKLVGGTFRHLALCRRLGQTGCVIAYSSFPSTPPADALFGRPGQGVSLQSGQTATQGLQVACVNPAALAGGPASLSPVFPALGTQATPWVSYPGRYTARCQQRDGATWLNVTKATGPADHRPTVTEQGGAAYGYHVWDLGLAQGNLTADVAAAAAAWTRAHR